MKMDSQHHAPVALPPRFPLNRKLDKTQFLSIYCVKKSFACVRYCTRFIGRHSLSLVTILTELSRLTPELMYNLEVRTETLTVRDLPSIRYMCMLLWNFLLNSFTFGVIICVGMAQGGRGVGIPL